jgi:hypothetical protein
MVFAFRVSQRAMTFLSVQVSFSVVLVDITLLCFFRLSLLVGFRLKSAISVTQRRVNRLDVGVYC